MRGLKVYYSHSDLSEAMKEKVTLKTVHKELKS